METDKKITLNIGIKDTIIVVLIGLLWFQNCSGSKTEAKHKKSNYDSLYAKMKSDSMKIVSLEIILAKKEEKLIASEAKSDSLTNIKSKANTKYHSSSSVVREEIRQGICDTVSVKEALNDCQYLQDVAESIIAQKDTTIKILKEQKEVLQEKADSFRGQVEAAKEIINGQSEDYKALEDDLKKEKRKGKIKTVILSVVHALKDAAILTFITR